MTGIRNPATEQADRILDLLDQPGQTSGEASYGTGRDGRCWRCNRHPEGTGESGMCDGCRTFMLGDSPDDPTTRRTKWTSPFPLDPETIGRLLSTDGWTA